MKIILLQIAAVAITMSLAGCNKGAPSDLSTAVQIGDVAAVKRIIAAGADVNKPSTGPASLPPLYLATMFAADLHDDPRPDARARSKDYQQIVELLLEKGADPNVKDSSGDTPLGRAARKGHLEIVELLISKGADVNMLAGDRTALDSALSRDRADTADFLRKHGGKTRAELEGSEQAGAGQPATRPESDSEGGDKPQPESEGRSR